MSLECNSFYHTKQPISIHQIMDKDTETAPATGTPQKAKPATASSDKKSFGRDVGKLVSGTVIAQIIGFCASPIVTRLFGPEIYGVCTLVLSIVSILSVIGCFRYEQSIVLPKEDRDASSLIFASLGILVGVCIISGLIMMLFGSEIGHLLNSTEVSSFLWVVPVILFVNCSYTLLRFWNTRKKRFGVQATTQVTQTLSSSGLQIGLGTAGLINPGSLLFSNIVGHLAGTLVLFWSIVKKDLQVIKSGLSFSNIKAQTIRYKKFPLIDSWANLLNSLSWQVPTLLLAAFFSPTVTAFYALGFMLLQTPMSLIGSSLGQVYFQRGAEEYRKGTLNHLLEDVTEMLLILSIVPLSLLLTMGGSMFGVVFGSQWTEAGVYCQILAVWAFVWFLTSTTGNTTYNIINKQELMMRFSIINLAVRLAALIIGGMCQSIYLALCLFTLSGIISYGYSIYLTFRETKASFVSVLRNGRTPILLTGVLIVISFILNYVLNLNAFILIGFAVLVCACYYLYLIRNNTTLGRYFPINLKFLRK